MFVQRNYLTIYAEPDPVLGPEDAAGMRKQTPHSEALRPDGEKAAH